MLVLKCIWGAILGAIGGFIAFIVGGIALWIVVGLITWNSKTGEAAANLAALCVPVGMVIGILSPIREETKRRQAADAAEEARGQRHREEQQGYRNQMIALGEESLVLFESMPNHLHSSEGYLDQAEVEFADGAFAPFWNCIENAAKLLGRFDEGVRQIKGNSTQYGTLIQKYEDRPPRFPLAHESVTRLDVATTSAKRMQAIVRKAQRDFQFATIYEQRKANQILVAGFTNLAQALNDMSWQIAASVDNLAQSVEGMASTLHESLDSIHSVLGDVVETASRHADESSKVASQASMREEKVLEMLDNIQRGRRPFP
ncbi:MAG: hypothetical protein ACT4PV_13205 [Planctomycetaceae bacterium]